MMGSRPEEPQTTTFLDVCCDCGRVEMRAVKSFDQERFVCKLCREGGELLSELLREAELSHRLDCALGALARAERDYAALAEAFYLLWEAFEEAGGDPKILEQVKEMVDRSESEAGAEGSAGSSKARKR